MNNIDIIDPIFTDLLQRAQQEKDTIIKNARIQASKGNAEGMYTLAIALMYGLGVGEDIETALDLLDRAANKGHAGAIYELASLYLEGNVTGVDKDLQKAKFYAEKIDNDNIKADSNAENFRQSQYTETVIALKKVIAIMEKKSW